jgi:hypothetical protein
VGLQDATLAGTRSRWQVGEAEVVVEKVQIRVPVYGYDLLVHVR